MHGLRPLFIKHCNLPMTCYANCRGCFLKAIDESLKNFSTILISSSSPQTFRASVKSSNTTLIEVAFSFASKNSKLHNVSLRAHNVSLRAQQMMWQSSQFSIVENCLFLVYLKTWRLFCDKTIHVDSFAVVVNERFLISVSPISKKIVAHVAGNKLFLLSSNITIFCHLKVSSTLKNEKLR